MPNDQVQIDNAECNENARVEYAAANDTYMHYDNFSWQVGSVLLAGVFIYWGFIVSNPPKLSILLVSNLLICLIMSIWLLYTEHNRQIYLFKLHRIRELEKQLGMFQHRRFTKEGSNPRVYALNQPRGHYLDDAIYIIVSLGGLLPGLLQAKDGEWCCLHFMLLAPTVFIVLGVVWRVHVMDNKAKSTIMRIDKEHTPENA